MSICDFFLFCCAVFAANDHVIFCFQSVWLILEKKYSQMKSMLLLWSPIPSSPSHLHAVIINPVEERGLWNKGTKINYLRRPLTQNGAAILCNSHVSTGASSATFLTYKLISAVFITSFILEVSNMNCSSHSFLLFISL